ncbi:MAG: preprotein translocase subunit SecA [Dehalococcoidales bacterium]|nr:preprotein translocase subunit SecA [Dehalococcoidales bacterium]
MFNWLGNLVDSNEKQLKKLQPIVDKINSLEAEYEKLSDEQLKAKTEEFKTRISSGKTLEELLPEAFAAVREAAKRTIKQRHFDVQLMGGIVLHQGKIAEMKTGEGKTLVATLPLYLNSLTGKGVHLVTVNDYLSKRDPYWMGPIYHRLGVSVSSIQGQQTAGAQGGVSFIYDPGYDSGKENDVWRHFRPITRKEAYQADITYGTNNEFGFDYLRDNMVIDLKQCVQRELNYAIVDEVDNILIDEARTPLIISGPAEEAARKYQLFARLIPNLKKDEDYVFEEKHNSVSLTDAGMTKMEGWLQHEGMLNSPNLYDPSNISLSRYLDNALKAWAIFKRDREYVVKDGQIIIVDEFTGRMMHGRRYSDGLHQALEAKEHVKVREESRTYATITFQNYFRMYSKLAGMTGTAVTEAEEFHKIYKLEVVVMPTNKPLMRKDLSDYIYKDEQAKFRAVAQEIEEVYKTRQPVLIGTISIEKSEILDDMLNRKGIPHQILNAKYHETEAAIIAQAGRLGAVTVATNMAGRGVDIILGGAPDGRNPGEWQKEHDEALKLGGLRIIGTERHEARRIDNQLRGRSGRQGDPGTSRFYVSLEDDIMRRFGGDRVKTIMEWAGIGEEDKPIENQIVSKSIESAQTRVEGYHFDVRKHLVEYDDVVNNQREIIYGERRKILGGADLKANVLSMVKEEIEAIIGSHTNRDSGDKDMAKLVTEVSTIMPLPADFNAEAITGLVPDEIESRLVERAEALYAQKEAELGADNMRMLERLLMLKTIDDHWVEHLTNMDYMRQGVGLRAVAQQDPLAAYKREGHTLFDGMMAGIQHKLVHTIFNVSITKGPPTKQTASPMAQVADASRAGGNVKPTEKVAGKKVGRNDPCPCGSGKKYKHCCGK